MPLSSGAARIALLAVSAAAAAALAACSISPDAPTGSVAPEATAPPSPRDAGAPPADAAADAPRTLCTSDCEPTRFAPAAKATGLACARGKLYAGTSSGKLLAFDTTAAEPEATELSPAPPSAVGFVAVADGTLFYTVPSAGEVHARELATGRDVRLTAGEDEPRGIAVRGDDVFFATRTHLRRIARVGADQAPTTRVTFADADPIWDVGLGGAVALAGDRFLVTHPEYDALALYAPAGAALVLQRHAATPTTVAMGATLAYYAENDGKLYAHAPLEKARRRIAVDQRFPGGMCVAEGRLYFVNDGEIRWLDVE